MSHLKVDLRLDGDDIAGSVEFGGPPDFSLEAMGMIVTTFAAKCGVPPSEVLTDIWRVINAS